MRNRSLTLINFDADPDDPSFQIKAQNLEKVLKYAHIPYSLTCHLHIDADPDSAPDPAYYFDADPDLTFQFDADPQHCLNDTVPRAHTHITFQTCYCSFHCGCPQLFSSYP